MDSNKDVRQKTGSTYSMSGKSENDSYRSRDCTICGKTVWFNGEGMLREHYQTHA